jgi:hypothetical protein
MSLAAYLVFLLIARVVALAWLGTAWSTIPDADRLNGRGEHISVRRAVGRLFVPFYNLYWIFAVHLGLCDALDRLAEWFDVPTRAPRGIAIAACVCTLVPYASILLSPLLWVTYASSVEAMKNELVERVEQPA